MSDISVIMITYNEGHNLIDVIDNINNLTDKIFVVDSYSNDNSIQLLKKNKINYVQKKFNNFGEQWNFAINNSPFKTKWVMKLDPDERIPDILIKEIKSKLKENDIDAFYIDRFIWFMGKKFNIKQKNLRIWKYGLCQFTDDLVNEKPMINGNISNLKNALEHHDSPNISHWLNKQNLYSSLEANYLIQNNKNKNRSFIKNNFYNFPFRYLILFLYHFLYLGSFRYGKKGYIWSYLRVLVYKIIEFKTYELYERKKTNEKT